MGSGRRHRHGPYRFYAPIYDMVFSSRLKGSYRGMYSALDLGHGDTVLEVGVGTGASLDFCPVGVKVEAIDFSEPMLEKARARIDSRADAPEVSRQKDGRTQTGVPDRYFDHSFSLPCACSGRRSRVCSMGDEACHEARREDSYRESLQEGRWGANISVQPHQEEVGLGMHVDFESMISECGLEIELTKKIGRAIALCLSVCTHNRTNEVVLVRRVCDQGQKTGV